MTPSRWPRSLRLTVGLAVLMVQYAVLPTLLAARFQVTQRYSGSSLSFQISAVLGGGLLPILASWTVGLADGHYWPAVNASTATTPTVIVSGP